MFHARHPTWPYTGHLLPDTLPTSNKDIQSPPQKYSQPLSSIDEDPFSHFLSPVLDEDDPYDDSSYTAGISTSDYPSPTLSDTAFPPHSSSFTRSTQFRARLEEKWEGFVARGLLSNSHSTKNNRGISSRPGPLPMPLSSNPRDMTMPSTPPGEDALPDLFIEDTEADAGTLTPDDEDDEMRSPSSASSTSPSTFTYFPTMSFDLDSVEADGWEADRQRNCIGLGIKRPSSSGKKTRPTFGSSSRTLSGKRHAWSVPSEDLWTVEEEGDEADEAEDDDDLEQYSRGRSGKGKRRMGVVTAKKPKFVHWNEEVKVLFYER